MDNTNTLCDPTAATSIRSLDAKASVFWMPKHPYFGCRLNPLPSGERASIHSLDAGEGSPSNLYLNVIMDLIPKVQKGTSLRD